MPKIVIEPNIENGTALDINLEEFVKKYFVRAEQEKTDFNFNLLTAQLDIIIYYHNKFKNLPEDIESKHKILRSFIEKERFIAYEHNKERFEIYLRTGNPEYLKCPKNSMEYATQLHNNKENWNL